LRLSYKARFCSGQQVLCGRVRVASWESKSSTVCSLARGSLNYTHNMQLLYYLTLTANFANAYSQFLQLSLSLESSIFLRFMQRTPPSAGIWLRCSKINKQFWHAERPRCRSLVIFLLCKLQKVRAPQHVYLACDWMEILETYRNRAKQGLKEGAKLMTSRALRFKRASNKRGTK
jgi:hypothetical protein